MAVTLHEVAIRVLAQRYPRVQTQGFKRRLIAARPGWDGIQTLRQRVNVRPDAFLIDRRAGHVLVFEIEDGHPMPLAKLDQYIDLWWALDEERRYALRLFSVDRYGRQQEIDLLALDLAWMQTDREQAP